MLTSNSLCTRSGRTHPVSLPLASPAWYGNRFFKLVHFCWGKSALQQQASPVPMAMKATWTAHQCMFDDLGSSPQDSLSAVQQSKNQDCVSCTHYPPIASLSSLMDEVKIRESLVSYLSKPSSSIMQLTPDERTFIVDTGASITITNSIKDFDCRPQNIKPTNYVTG